MSRPDRSEAQRRRMIPILARAFAELGYRRTTTAELARRCGVRENILYRHWPDKKSMFLASIDFVYDNTVAIWDRLLAEESPDATVAERLLDYESEHHGEFGLYRIVFAGLTETDDPEIRSMLARMYRRFHRFVSEQIEAHRRDRGRAVSPAPEVAAWGLVGLGTLIDIVRELRLAPSRERKEIFNRVGKQLLEGES
jgi:AcrR family transcriptional regulator